MLDAERRLAMRTIQRALPIALALATGAAAQQPSWRLRTDLLNPGTAPNNWGVTMVYDAQRQVCVIVGGTHGGGTYTWDGQVWTQHPSFGTRVTPGLAYDSARAVVVAYGGDFPFVADTWEWNGQSWTQRPGSGPGLRTRHGMAYDSDRHVVVLYGGVDQAFTPIRDTWEYDGQAWTQRSTNDAPGGGRALAYDAARHVTVLVDNQSTWAWDGQSWTTLAASPLGPFDDASLAFDSDRDVCVLFAGPDFEYGRTFEWNGTAWTLTTSTFPYARPLNGFAYDSHRKRIVLAGGRCNCDSGGTNETWEYGLICRADCDGYSHPPALNILDFACFLNAFAAGNSLEPYQQARIYVNCDGSTTDPVLNIADFACFLNAFVAGCS
jgi:hypothetical protein